MSTTLDLIKHHGLLVRPPLIPGQWRAGLWKGVTGHLMGQAYCADGTEWEAETLEEAVRLCTDALVAGRLNPAWISASTNPEHVL